MKRPVVRWVLVACLFGVILYASLYFRASHGEAFRFVKEQIASSSVMEGRLGAIRKITLDPVGGYRERFVNENKSVHMTVDVVGVKGEASIKVFARRNNGVWKIVDASIDGQEVQLTN